MPIQDNIGPFIANRGDNQSQCRSKFPMQVVLIHSQYSQKYKNGLIGCRVCKQLSLVNPVDDRAMTHEGELQGPLSQSAAGVMIATVATAATIATAREQRYAAFCCVVSNGYSVWQAGARLAIKALSQLINDLRQAPSRVFNTPPFCLVGSLHLHGLACSKIWASSSLLPSYVEHVVFLDLRSILRRTPAAGPGILRRMSSTPSLPT